MDMIFWKKEKKKTLTPKLWQEISAQTNKTVQLIAETTLSRVTILFLVILHSYCFTISEKLLK